MCEGYTDTYLMMINFNLQVNKNIIHTWNLELIPSNIPEDEVDDTTASPFTKRIDSRIPGMSPVYCIEDGYAEEDIVCVLQVGGLYVVPVFNHFGTFDKNEKCDW